jgi:putative transposase
MNTVIKTLRLRIKDNHSKQLNQWAFEVNQVWNAANALSAEYSWVPIPEIGFMNLDTSEYDLQKELKTICVERDLTIGAATVQSIIATHAKARKQFKKNKLKWRSSSGSKRALGWIPFKASGIKYINGQIRFCGQFFSLWDSYNLSKYDLSTGSFSQDARGRWYFNVTVKVEVEASAGVSSIGIDLGLKDTATCSDGIKLERKERYRNLASKLGIAQRANKSKLVKSIHAKIKNQRKDDIHKFTTKLTKEHGAIFVGNVSSSKLVKTKMAKSVNDAGWFMLKTQLEYKANARSVVFQEVNEKYTTQTCSDCGLISVNSPKGRAGLGIREWTCAKCGTTHDRDINASKNILRIGHDTLAGGIPLL